MSGIVQILALSRIIYEGLQTDSMNGTFAKGLQNGAEIKYPFSPI